MSYEISFLGSFDGNDHTISGLYVTNQEYVGLFGVMDKYSSASNIAIRNVMLANSYNGSFTITGMMPGEAYASEATVTDHAPVTLTASPAPRIQSPLEDTKVSILAEKRLYSMVQRKMPTVTSGIRVLMER